MVHNKEGGSAAGKSVLRGPGRPRGRLRPSVPIPSRMPVGEANIVRAAAALREVTPSTLVRSLVVPAARAILAEAGQDPDALPVDG